MMRAREGVSSWIPLAVFFAALIPFLNAVPGGFFWDDIQNLRDNSGFRAFDWAHVRWMLTATWMGHFTPLVWLSFAADHALWGLEPAGYHLTNIFWHGGNAVLVYFLARRLLVLAAPRAQEDAALGPAAAFAALVFALHPLRVESVAWLTERRDVLSSFFLLAGLLAYLAACEREGGERWKRLAAALFLYECSLLAKESGVTLPAVLCVLDVYPLRRLGGEKGWRGPAARRVWAEKALFLLAALPTLVLTPMRVYRSGSLVSAAKLGTLRRIAVFFYGLAFYVRKTVWPAGLAPFYPFPATAHEAEWIFLVGAALVLAAAALAFALRRRFPALGAAEAVYALTLTPVAGLIQNGPQIAADRYSYVSCLPWAFLAGGALLWALRRTSSSRALQAGCAAAAVSLCAALGLVTAAQAAYWTEPTALWRRTAALFPESALPQIYLAESLSREGKDREAAAAYEAALRAEPLSATSHESYGGLLKKLGRARDAERELRRALELNPGIEEAHELLGHVLEESGRGGEAGREYAAAAALKPDDPQALIDKGAMLLEAGLFVAAEGELSRAALLDPGSAHARYDLALALAGEGRTAQAVEEYEKVVELDPGYVEARVNLGNLLVRSGRAREALEQYQAALRLAPASPGAHYNLGALLEAGGDAAGAKAEYERALRLRPDYSEARAGLGRLARPRP